MLVPRQKRWIEISWKTYRNDVEQTAAGLAQLNVVAGDRVAIFSNTRFEWAVVDLAVLSQGAITVPIYQSSTAEDLEFIMQDSQATVLFCESETLLSRYRDVIGRCTAIKKIIYFDEVSPNSDVQSLSKLQEYGEEHIKKNPQWFADSSVAIRLSQTATILYTSGTTGRPKGVVLTHQQIMSEVSDTFPLLGVTVKDRSLTFLPFAHILGRLEIWGHVLTGFTMAFAESIDHLKDNLAEIKPTIMITVPRIFEKIYNGILAQAEISPVRSKIFQWAMSVGHEISQIKIQKKPVPIAISLKYQLAKKLVFAPLNKKMGGQLRFAVCGGAPLSPQLGEFFHAAGLLILEGYGLTETTGAICVNTPFDYRFGSVGKPLGDTKIKFAEDGEILIHGKKVMKEYYNDSQATAQALTDGWFHTGDIGEMSADGFLRITDRKKDLIKTAGGKYVAPQKLEGLLKASRFISNVHIHGDQRKYIVALITLNMDAIKKVAIEKDLSYKDAASLSQNADVRELIRQAVADANANLASYESIKNFAILNRDFTIENGELTPSLKVKRKFVDAEFKDVIEKLYGVGRSTSPIKDKSES